MPAMRSAKNPRNPRSPLLFRRFKRASESGIEREAEAPSLLGPDSAREIHAHQAVEE